MPTAEVVPKPLKKLNLILFAPAFVLIALMCWALASPVGASPDDDFHLASIWCAQGPRGSDCEPAAKPNSRVVPKAVSDSAVCYAFHPDISAACQPSGSGAAAVKATDRGNFTGLYPPVYYATMSMFVLPDVVTSVILMRAVNALIFLGLTTGLFLLLPERHRPALVWAWVISTVPLGTFLLASNNPSSWAIISAGTLWIALIGYFQSSGRRKIALGGIAVIAAVMGAGSRGDSAVFSVLGVIVALILSFRNTRQFWLSALMPFGIVLVAVGFYFSAGQSLVAANGLGSNGGDVGGGNLRYLLMNNLLEVPKLWAGVFGSWGLGWLDTTLPGIVSVGCLVCFAAVAFAGLGSRSLPKTVAVALVMFTLVAFPVYILVQTHTIVGSGVQPRYLLPLIVILGGVSLYAGGGHRIRFSSVQRYFVVFVLAIANAISLHINIRRYVTGIDVSGWNLDADVEWWWNLPISPMGVWALGSISFALSLFIVVLHVSKIQASLSGVPDVQDRMSNVQAWGRKG